MNRVRPALALAALSLAGALPASAEAKLTFRDCDGDACARLAVPLDHGGAVPGSLTLKVTRRTPISRRESRGVALVLSGGAGVPGTEHTLYDWDDSLRGFDLVTFEARGTGRGRLRCRDLEAATATDAGREAEACAALLGERRGFFRASDTVEDIELLRQELGAERLTLIGPAYGSYVAQRYALRYPERVDRLVLEHVVDAGGVDPLYLAAVAAAPRVLAEHCRTGCRSFTRDPAGDTARLVARLAVAPLRGAIVGPTGRRRAATLTRQDLLFTLVASDGNFIIRSEYPAAVASALAGDPAPLLRLKRRATATAAVMYPRFASAATTTAASCEAIRFPWAWHSSPSERAEAAHRTETQMAPVLAGPFDPGTLVRSDLMRLCRRWPTASPGPPPEPGPMPDVPALLLANPSYVGYSVEAARRAAERFPRAKVLVTSDAAFDDDCADLAVQRFVRGRRVQDRCPRTGPVILPSATEPRSLMRLAPAPGVPGRAGRLVRAVGVTVGDLVDDTYARIFSNPDFLFLGEDDVLRGGGLRGGYFRAGEDLLRLHRYQVVPGVRLSGGWIGEDESPVRVDGPGRLDGILRLRERDGRFLWVRGRIAGRRVGTRVPVPSRLVALFEEDEGGSGVATGRSAARRIPLLRCAAPRSSSC